MNTIIRRIALCCVFLATIVPVSFAQSIGNYTYDASGNVESIGPDTQGLTNFYDYDSAGRLIRFVRRNAAGTAVLTETFEYDAYGNLTKQTTNGTATTLPTAASTNRLTAATYDAAGNMTAYGSETYVFDPVGTMTKKSGSWGSAFYVYTADDERIGIEGPDLSWRYMGRDLDGKVLREWSATSGTATTWSWVEDYIYRDGQLAAAVRPDLQGGVRHFHLDHLGSPRLITSATASLYAEHTYYPYGREITSPTQELDLGHDTPEPMKFTGHERDFAGSYTGPVLDYMHARYYNPQAGRFLSVDPVPGEQSRPRSWNLYTYVQNNPISNADPLGLKLRVMTADAASDLCGLIGPGCNNLIHIDQNGLVTVTASRAQVGANEALKLIDDMVSSPKMFGAWTGTSMPSGNNTIILGDRMIDNRVVNLSTTARTDVQSNLPLPAGFDGAIGIFSGYTGLAVGQDGKPVSRELVMFHELAENYYRTEKMKQYAESHQNAITRENLLRQQRPGLSQYTSGAGPNNVTLTH